MKHVTLAILCALALAGCKQDEDAGLPPPATLTSEALGYYCQMIVADHAGPKAQMHLAGVDAPIFFSQVRDGIAYQRMPEQDYEIAAFYVSDMSAAPNWEDPGADNWILASKAAYVIGSDAVGGMGAPEAVPFSDRSDAEAFIAAHGGRIVSLSEIPDADVMAPGGHHHDHEEDDYQKRLNSLSQEGRG